jgi:hypothetical protein
MRMCGAELNSYLLLRIKARIITAASDIESMVDIISALMERLVPTFVRNRLSGPRPDRKEQHIKLLEERSDLIAAEIGVWHGENAERILRLLDIQKLFLIDPYEAYSEYPERKSDPNKMSYAEETARDRLSEHDNVHWIKEYSDEAVTEIEQGLDYVYVDGNHHYEFVKSDIENYYPLLNETGIIAGDDANWIGVSQAVAEFAVENGIQPHFKRDHPDWFFLKDEPIDTKTPLPDSSEDRAVTKQDHTI